MPCSTEIVHSEDQRLLVDVHLTAQKIKEMSDLGGKNSFRALIDTGATKSGISNFLARQLNLMPMKMVRMKTAGGIVQAAVYKVNIHPVIVQGNTIYTRHYLDVEVNEYPKHANDDFDVLLGMDLISRGSLHVSGGHFTFCI